VPALSAVRNTVEEFPDTGTSPPVHGTVRWSSSSGGVTRSEAGVFASAPLISGLENDSPAHALLPGASVTAAAVPD